jgi:hypothetical protein
MRRLLITGAGGVLPPPPPPFLSSPPPPQDRRHRQLHVTPKGARLARELAQVQTRRFLKAADTLGEGGRKRASAFLLAMIDDKQRDRVVELIGAEDPGESLAPADLHSGEPD